MYLCPIGTFAYTVKSGDTLAWYRKTTQHISRYDYFITLLLIWRLSIGRVCSTTDMSSDFDSSGSCRYVTVEPGDTLNEYAREFKTTVEEFIIMANLELFQII